MKVETYQIVPTVERYAEAAAAVKSPGDCAIVERGGQQRQLVLCCPDGCGETLSINLDSRSGPAWRLFRRRGTWSLFPSIDRTSGCFSHFILWHGRILWCDGIDAYEPELDEAIVARVLAAFQDDAPFRYTELADQLGELPWDVLSSCRTLVRRKLLSEGKEKKRGTFWMRRD